MSKLKQLIYLLIVGCGAIAQCSGAAASTGQALIALQPAERLAHATSAEMLGAAWAGQRVVAVGVHGIILLSDDQGTSWRQATQVPVDATLNAVSFSDDKTGWAVGHWGLILQTRDGGESWEVQRSALDEDRPLFAVHFLDASHGVAVGLWSLILTTKDGGRHWVKQDLPAPEGARRADLNLFGLFVSPTGEFYAAAEKGFVLRSTDRGASWNYLRTGYKGSFWTGIAMKDGVLLAGGLRGALYRSSDYGKNWSRIDTRTTSSITSLARTGSDQGITAVGLDGLILRSNDNGTSFGVGYRNDRISLTSILPFNNFNPPMMSSQGPAPADKK